MPSIYTIEGARPRKRRKRRKGPVTAQQRRFKAASKKCKGQSRRAFQACMRRELKR